MKRKLLIFGILATALLLMVACTPKTPTYPAQQIPPMDYEPEYQPQAPTQSPSPVDTTAEQDVVVVDQEVVEIDSITVDMDLNDLDNLDQELAELDNLEI